MNLINICSGSAKNSTLIYDDKTIILIDCGAGIREINRTLKSINKDIDDIDFVFITHNHIDHIKNLKYFDFDKIYAVKDIVLIDNLHYLKHFEEYDFDNFLITPLELSHDVKGISGFLIKNGKEKLAYITDTGYIPFKTLELIKNLDYYYFESNHNIQMLMCSNRSDSLKARIVGSYGHLSNEQAGIYLSYLIGKKTKKILLAHLSEECNDPMICLDEVKDILLKNKIKVSELDIRCLKQREPTVLWLK